MVEAPISVYELLANLVSSGYPCSRFVVIDEFIPSFAIAVLKRQ